jgi:hypothetical protein
MRCTRKLSVKTRRDRADCPEHPCLKGLPARSAAKEYRHPTKSHHWSLPQRNRDRKAPCPCPRPPADAGLKCCRRRSYFSFQAFSGS